MPIYEYKCENCGEVFERIQKFSDDPVTTHEKCGGHVERLISRSALHFKGTGWYVTDYARSGAKPDANGASKSETESGKSGESKSESNSEQKSESKSEQKSESKTESKSESKPASSTDSKSESKADTSSGSKSTTKTD